MKYLSYIFLLLLFIACKPTTPDGILSPDEMEDVLYDMHKAQAMYDQEQKRESTADILALRASVLKKYDITQAEWDTSYNYYCRNAHQLWDIYNSLSQRVERDVVALGGKIDGIQGEEADTANVWKSESSFILMQQSPYNIYSFAINPDSTFQDGDRINLQYDVQFIFQDGYRDVTAYLAIYYDNDSIYTQVSHTTGDSHGIITISNDVDRLHIKQIKGFFMLSQNIAQPSAAINTSTLRLASVRNVKLLHLPTTPPAPTTPQPEQKDSLNADSLRLDSLKEASGLHQKTTNNTN